MNCSNWSEIDFVKYCQNELNPTERSNFESHLNDCSSCQERFTLCCKIILTECSPEDEQAIRELLNSKTWQDSKAEIVKKFASLLKKRSNHNGRAVLKAAAMLLLMLAPVGLTYKMLIKPLYESHNGTASAPSSNLSPRLATLAKRFETINARLISNPDDMEALLKRAACFEDLLLFEDARIDYRRYLDLAVEPAKRSEIENHLETLSSRMTSSPAQQKTGYELLDSHIDDYLKALASGSSSEALNILSKADHIADRLAEKSGDQFGRDLVSFYRSMPSDLIVPLREARSMRLEVEKRKGNEDYSPFLQKTYETRAIFERCGSSCDLEQIDIQIVRYLYSMGEVSRAKEHLDSVMERASENRHHYSYAQYLIYQGRYFMDSADSAGARASLEKAIQIASQLDMPQLISRAMVSLAYLHHSTNENARAFELSYEALESTRAINDRFRMLQLMQVLGISLFNLDYPTLADHYMKNATALAGELNHPYMYALSKSYAAIMQAEQNNFRTAEDLFTEAFNSFDKVTDTGLRSRIEFYVTGYYARSQMLAGNVERAVEFYSRALYLGGEAKIEEKLTLSQLHQGLGECLMARGDLKGAESQFAAAVALNSEAQARAERSNPLLTFAVTRKNCNEQMQILRRSLNN
jgi:tetratricopeptide (TPR) repeat protein